jgi:hypothetical protein
MFQRSAGAAPARALREFCRSLLTTAEKAGLVMVNSEQAAKVVGFCIDFHRSRRDVAIRGHDGAVPKGSSPKRDFMEVARGIVEQAIGEQMDGSTL